MKRCVSCERPDRAGEELQGDFWCHACIVDGKYAGYVEAQALVASIIGNHARRAHDIPPPRAVRVKHGPL